MSKSRLEAFSDGVMAIVITILVLSIHSPSSNTVYSLIDLRHKILVYALSFFMVATYWNNHHHMFSLVKVINGRILWANHLFLFSLTFLPFVTEWVGDYITSFVPELAYGIVSLFVNLSFFNLSWQLYLKDEDTKKFRRENRSLKKIVISVVLNLLALLLGWLVHPLFILIVNTINYTLWIVPNKKLEEYLKSNGKEELKK